MADTEGNGNGNVLLHRVGEIERKATRIDGELVEARRLVDQHSEQISGQRGLLKALDELGEDLADLNDELKALRRAAWAVAAAIVAGTLGILVQIPSP